MFNRLTELRESQTRALSGDLRSEELDNHLYPRGGHPGCLEAFSAGFRRTVQRPINPAQWQNIVDYYNNTFIKETERYSGTDTGRRGAAAAFQRRALPAGQLHRIASRNDNAITMTDARDGSKWSTANQKYQDFFRQIVTRFEFQDALLIDAAGSVVFNACQGCRSRHQHRDGSLLGIQTPGGLRQGDVVERGRLCGLTDFEFYQPAENTPTAWMVALLRRDGRPEGVLRCSSRSRRSTG